MRPPRLGTLFTVLLVLALVACNNDDQTTIDEANTGRVTDTPLGSEVAVADAEAAVANATDDQTTIDEEGSTAIGIPMAAVFAASLWMYIDENEALAEAADAARERALAARQAAERAHARWVAAGENPEDEEAASNLAAIQHALETAALAETAAITATARVNAVEIMLQWAPDLAPSEEETDRADAAGPDSETAAAIRKSWNVAFAAIDQIKAAVADTQAAIANAEAAVADAEAAVADAEPAVADANDDQTTMDEEGTVYVTPATVGFAASLWMYINENEALAEAADAARERALAARQAAERAHARWVAAGENPEDEEAASNLAAIQHALETAALAETAAITATARVNAVEIMLQWAPDLAPSEEETDRADAAGPDSETAAAIRKAWNVAFAVIDRIRAAVAEAEAAVAEAEAAVAEAEAAVAEALP